MYQIQTTNRFDKQYQLMLRRGYNIEKLDKAIQLLAESGTLPQSYKPHKLKGRFADCWEAHIEPDWLLVWKLFNHELLLMITATGTHSDLF